MSSSGPRIVFDVETGEALIAAPLDGYTVVSTKQRDAYRARLAAAEVADGRRYVTTYTEAAKRAGEALELPELGALVKLLPYMRMGKGGALADDRGRPVGNVEIGRIIGKGDRTVKSIVAALKRAGILRDLSGGGRARSTYAINPDYHAIGGKIARQYFVKLYTDRGAELTAGLSIQAAGVLYRALPYVNYASLFLSEQPDVDGGGCMNVGRFAAICGLSTKQMARLVRELIESRVCIGVLAGRELYLRFNPELIGRRLKGDIE